MIKAPILRNWDQMKYVEGLGIVDPTKPIYTLQPLYQDDKLVCYMKQVFVPPVKDGRKIGEWGAQEFGYDKLPEGFPE
jgi:hypothetical protein